MHARLKPICVLFLQLVTVNTIWSDGGWYDSCTNIPSGKRNQLPSSLFPCVFCVFNCLLSEVKTLLHGFEYMFAKLTIRHSIIRQPGSIRLLFQCTNFTRVISFCCSQLQEKNDRNSAVHMSLTKNLERRTLGFLHL